MYTKYMIGKEVRCTFWDHSSSSKAQSGAILCCVRGKISAENKIAYEIMSWEALHTEPGTADYNSEVFTILKSTITELVVFGRGKKIKVK